VCWRTGGVCAFVGAGTLVGSHVKTSKLILLGLFLGVCSALAQVASSPPEKSWASRNLEIGHSAHRESLSYNQPSEILKEVLDTNVLRLITGSLRLDEMQLRSVRLAPNGRGDAVVYQVWESIDKPFEKLAGRLRNYVADRFMAAAVPSIPVSWWRKEPTTILGDGTREIEFFHVDGEIAWRYLLHCHTNGQYEFPIQGPFDEKCDPKEYDAKDGAVIREVLKQVRAEMVNDGTWNDLKRWSKCNEIAQQRLLGKGVSWRSPYTFKQHRYE
jgi:hypothetical protein